MIKEQSLETFLAALAGKASTPGGGSAAAVMGAMGAALLSMVANFTVGKKGYEAVDGAMRDALSQSEALRAALTELIQEDVKAFDAVMAAYGMPRDDEAQKQVRTRAIQSALKLAADVPLRCAELCAQVVRLAPALAASGNRNVISDAGVAALAADAALQSAAFNVEVNLNAIKDEEFVRDRRARLDTALEECAALKDAVCGVVRGKL